MAHKSLEELPVDYYLEMLGVQSELACQVNVEYLLLHKKSGASYFNIYQSKWRAYLNAIDPRYWSYHTVVFLRPKDIKPVEVVDYSHIT